MVIKKLLDGRISKRKCRESLALKSKIRYRAYAKLPALVPWAVIVLKNGLDLKESYVMGDGQ